MRKFGYSLASVLAALSVAPAGAMDAKPNGNMDLMPYDVAWAVPVDDSELREMRGGFNGIAFSFWVQGSIEDLTTQTTTNPATTAVSPVTDVTATDLSFTSVNGDLQLGTVISGNFQGASGIFQIASVPGSNVSVTNSLTMQVTVVNVVDSVSISALRDVMGF